MNSERSNATLLHTNISCPPPDGQRTIFHQSTTIIVHQQTHDFFLLSPRSSYRTLILDTRLGEILQITFFAKSVPEGLKFIVWAWHRGKEFSHLLHSQEVSCSRGPREKQKKPTTSSWHYLTWAASSKSHYGRPGLPSSLYCMCARWFMNANWWSMTSSSPEQRRLLQLQCWTWRSWKMSMHKFTTWRKKAKGNKWESTSAASNSVEAAKSAYQKVTHAVDASKTSHTMEGAKVFELYWNLLSN